MRPAGSSSRTFVGIDPGAVCGIVVVGYALRDVLGTSRQFIPKIRDARVIEAAGMLADPTGPAGEILRIALLLASMHEACAVGLEIPMLLGGGRGRRVVTYGAQRELIGAIRLGLREWDVVDVAPRQAKAALADDSLATKRGMLEGLKRIAGWERCWDTAKYRLEAKADAAGIALAAAKIWEKRNTTTEVGT